MELFVPQLAQLESRPPQGADWIHEIKFDGYRTLAYFEKGVVTLRTRSGLNWTTKYSSIARDLRKLKLRQTVLDGEIVWLDDDGKSDFQKLQNALKAGESSRLVFFVFDILEHNGKDIRQRPLLERKDILRKILSRKTVPDSIRFAEHWSTNPGQLLAASCELGLEGLISKRADSEYQAGRSKTWIKSKCTKEQEFVIGGYTQAAGSRVGFRSLLLGVYNDDGEFEYVGKVGTGFTQRSLMELTEKMRPLRQDESPFDIRSPRSSSITWLKPKLVAQIKFTEWTSEKSLRHPVFDGLREDKRARLVRAETQPGV